MRLTVKSPPLEKLPWNVLEFEHLKLTTPLIQMNETISSFHLDDSLLAGTLILGKHFQRVIKIWFVAKNDSIRLRRYLTTIAKALYDSNRLPSVEQHIKEVLGLVKRKYMTMHVHRADQTAHLLKHGLWHLVVTCFTEMDGAMRISFANGEMKRAGNFPPALKDQDEKDTRDFVGTLYTSSEQEDKQKLEEIKTSESMKGKSKKRKRLQSLQALFTANKAQAAKSKEERERK